MKKSMKTMITPEVLRMRIPLDVSRWVFLVYGIPYTRNPTVGAMLRIGLYNVFHTIIETSHAGNPKPGRLATGTGVANPFGFRSSIWWPNAIRNNCIHTFAKIRPGDEAYVLEEKSYGEAKNFRTQLESLRSKSVEHQDAVSAQERRMPTHTMLFLEIVLGDRLSSII